MRHLHSAFDKHVDVGEVDDENMLIVFELYMSEQFQLSFYTGIFYSKPPEILLSPCGRVNYVLHCQSNLL